MVVCTGDLVKQVVNSSNTLKTSYFEQKKPILPMSVALAVGHFKVVPDPTLPHVTHFCLPHMNTRNVQHTIAFTAKIMVFVEEFLGVKYTDFFGSYKQVFVDDAFESFSPFASMSIFKYVLFYFTTSSIVTDTNFFLLNSCNISTDMLLDEKVVENTLDVHKNMVFCIASQFFGNFVHPKAWCDMWLVHGFAGYVALQYLKHEFGNNEYRYQIWREGRILRQMDHHTQPLYCKEFIHPTELATQLMYRKSAAVVYMIDRIIKTHLRKHLTKMLTDALASNTTTVRRLGTKAFLNNVKMTEAEDLKPFAKCWM